MKKKRNQGEPQKLTDTFVSIIVPAGESVQNIAPFTTGLAELLHARYTNYEIIIIDNGLPIEQVEAMYEVFGAVPCVRMVRLSRDYPHDTAVFAGLEAAIGDYVCVVDPVVDPIDTIPEIIRVARSGYDVVQGVSDTAFAGSVVARIGRRLFYWYHRRYLGVNIPSNATYLYGFNRRAVNALTNTNRNHRHVRQLSHRIGFRLKEHEYTPLTSPYNDKKVWPGVLEALEIVTNYSTHPLSLVTWLGVIAGVANVVYAGYVVLIHTFKKQVAEGWTTLSLQSSLMFFVLFLILVILSEYIGRILTESRKEPPYHVMEELTSTVAIADESRRNITH